MTGVRADVQRLEPDALIELFELDLTRWSDEILRFHAHAHGGVIKWGGHPYGAWPMQVSGFGRTGDAAQPTPTLSVANLDGFVTKLCIKCSDLVGASVRRRRTLAQYLDGSPSADSSAEMPVELWVIEQKTLETATLVEFSLSSVLDLSGRKLPARQVVGSVCQWQYRGPECGYDGPPYFTRNNSPTVNEKEDVCGKRLACCRCRHMVEAELPFGGFPAAGAAGFLVGQ